MKIGINKVRRSMGLHGEFFRPSEIPQPKPKGKEDGTKQKRPPRAPRKRQHNMSQDRSEMSCSETNRATEGLLGSNQLTDRHVGQSHDRLDQSERRSGSCDQRQEVISSWDPPSWSCDQPRPRVTVSCDQTPGPLLPWLSTVGKHTQEGTSVASGETQSRPQLTWAGTGVPLAHSTGLGTLPHSTGLGTLTHSTGLGTLTNPALFDPNSAMLMDSLTRKWFPPS